MRLIETKTNKELKGVIEVVTPFELRTFKKLKGFGFDWTKEKEGTVYKIRLENSEEILGLFCLIDVSEEFRIHLNLIEVSSPYRGSNKPIQNIAGCMLAFACSVAIKKGYGGFVSLLPKTELIKYYESHGFVFFGNQMAVMDETATALIKKYFNHE